MTISVITEIRVVKVLLNEQIKRLLTLACHSGLQHLNKGTKIELLKTYPKYVSHLCGPTLLSLLLKAWSGTTSALLALKCLL